MLLKMRRHPLQPFPLRSTHTSEGMSVEIRWVTGVCICGAYCEGVTGIKPVSGTTRGES